MTRRLPGEPRPKPEPEREWQPGDVAVMLSGGEPVRIFCYRDFATGDIEWMSATEGGAYPNSENPPRPLAVIDPEDREQVERVIEAIVCAQDWTPYDADDHDAVLITKVQAALRVLANPPPPEPPVWSVAVVADSTPFLRTAEDHITPPYDECWVGEHPTTGERMRSSWRGLHELGEVRVVNEGVAVDE